MVLLTRMAIAGSPLSEFLSEFPTVESKVSARREGLLSDDVPDAAVRDLLHNFIATVEREEKGPEIVGATTDMRIPNQLIGVLSPKGTEWAVQHYVTKDKLRTRRRRQALVLILCAGAILFFYFRAFE